MAFFFFSLFFLLYALLGQLVVSPDFWNLDWSSACSCPLLIFINSKSGDRSKFQLLAGISWEIKFSELNFLLCKILLTKVIVNLVENVSLYNSKYAINISGFHIASAIPRWFFSAVKTAQIPFTWFWEAYWTDLEYLDAYST